MSSGDLEHAGSSIMKGYVRLAQPRPVATWATDNVQLPT